MAKKNGKLTSSSVGCSYSGSMLLIDDETFNDPVIRDRVMCPVVDGEQKGQGLVPRDYSIYPVQMFQPVTDLKLLDQAQIDAIIEDQEKNQSSLEHICTWESLDQNGQGYCHDDSTEVLTEKGWVGWPDYNWKDLLGTVNQLTGEMEFQKPFQKHVYEYKGELVHSTNRRIDFGVTPDHRMLVRKWDQSRQTLSDAYSFVTAQNLGWYVGLPHAPQGFVGTGYEKLRIDGDREYTGDDFLALLGLIISDGYAGGSDNTKNWVSFASFREGTRSDIDALARRNGFHECPGRRGVWIRYDAAALAAWLRVNCYDGNGLRSQNKRLPELVKCATMRQIRHFLHYFDDRNREGSQFYSTSKRLIDDLQELHLRIGKRSSIGWSEGKEVPFADSVSGVIRSKGGYVLTVGGVDRLCLDRKKHIERDRYNGLVYCAAVPNGTLVTRRNGSVLISGNCWFYSTTSCVMALRSIMNLPHVRLSAHAGAWKIKGGRDEGGWCGLSAKFHKEVGCPSVALWPEKSMSRQHDKPETWANAALHKVTEDWQDVTRDIYDQRFSLQQLDTLLACNIPCATDFNWWGHSVMMGRLVKVEAGSYGRAIRNSWSQSWGKNGWSVLRGSKAVPDSAIALRVTKASVN